MDEKILAFGLILINFSWKFLRFAYYCMTFRATCYYYQPDEVKNPIISARVNFAGVSLSPFFMLAAVILTIVTWPIGFMVALISGCVKAVKTEVEEGKLHNVIVKEKRAQKKFRVRLLDDEEAALNHANIVKAMEYQLLGEQKEASDEESVTASTVGAQNSDAEETQEYKLLETIPDSEDDVDDALSDEEFEDPNKVRFEIPSVVFPRPGV
jgi:hypothetical protein